MPISSRRDFLKFSFALSGGLLTSTLLSPAVHSLWAADERPPRQEPELVAEFVRIAHFDFARTQELLTETPTLIQSSHDWGGGDWETAIEAASHVGNKEIAAYLLHHGARMTLFTAVMMGQMEIVKPALDAYPYMIRTNGPHGLSMLHHAEKGGDAAMIVYIQQLSNNN